jgi:xanthine/uracil permease
MISADLAESDFTDETSPEAACAVVLFVFGLIPRVLRIPSAIPFAI